MLHEITSPPCAKPSRDSAQSYAEPPYTLPREHSPGHRYLAYARKKRPEAHMRDTGPMAVSGCTHDQGCTTPYTSPGSHTTVSP